MICSPSPKMLSFAVLCWGIQAKWESQVTDLLGEPQVRSSSDMRQQWIPGTEQSITLRQRQASGGGMNFPLETPPVQRRLRIQMREQVPGFCAASTAASGMFGKGRKRSTSRRAQEEGMVGSKKKSNSLQRHKNLRKSIQRFRKKGTGLPRGQLLCSMTRCPTTTGRATIVQRFVVIFTPAWRKKPAESKTVLIRWERFFWHTVGSSRLGIRAACVARMKDLQRKKKDPLSFLQVLFFIIKF